MAADDLYILQMDVTGDIKVGRSKNPEKRCRQVQNGAPHQLRIILHAPGQGPREKALHRYLREFRTRRNKGEWFREEALGSLPVDLYELLPEEYLDNCDWWQK